VNLLHPYLLSSLSVSQVNDKFARITEDRLTGCVVSVLGTVIPHLKEPDHRILMKVESDLISLLSNRTFGVSNTQAVYVFGLLSYSNQVVNVAVPCICLIVARVTRSYSKLTGILRKCISKFFRI
jgi:hypothetical protein